MKWGDMNGEPMKRTQPTGGEIMGLVSMLTAAGSLVAMFPRDAEYFPTMPGYPVARIERFPARPGVVPFLNGFTRSVSRFVGGVANGRYWRYDNGNPLDVLG